MRVKNVVAIAASMGLALGLFLPRLVDRLSGSTLPIEGGIGPDPKGMGLASESVAVVEPLERLDANSSNPRHQALVAEGLEPADSQQVLPTALEVLGDFRNLIVEDSGEELEEKYAEATLADLRMADLALNLHLEQRRNEIFAEVMANGTFETTILQPGDPTPQFSNPPGELVSSTVFEMEDLAGGVKIMRHRRIDAESYPEYARIAHEFWWVGTRIRRQQSQ